MKLLTETEVSSLYNFPVKTLQAWRHRKTGPAWLKIGSSVRYRESDIEIFLEGCKRNGGAEK